jgi:hypothetical protein
VYKNVFHIVPDFEKIMRVFSALIFGAQNVGQTSSWMPDYTKAKVAIQRIFELFEREPKIDNWNFLFTENDALNI